MIRSMMLFAVLLLMPRVAWVEEPAPARVDRHIGAEPTYTADQQFYALLLLGPEKATRVWFVVDGTDLHVDRNGDGDLTGENEKFTSRRKSSPGGIVLGSSTWNVPSIGTGDRYKDVKVRFAPLNKSWAPSETASNRKRMQDFMVVAATLSHPQLSSIEILIDGKTNQQTANASFGTSATTAPVFCMDAPLTLGVLQTVVPYALWNEAGDQKITICAGNVGEGPCSFSYVDYNVFPDDARPIVELRFPPAAGGKPQVPAILDPLDRC